VEKIWLKNYSKNVPAEINPDIYRSLVEVLEDSCKRYASCPAFYNLGVTLTFKQIDDYARSFASYLQQDLKLKKGDRVAIMLPNVLQYPIVMFAILRAGLIAVNVNPLYTAPELIHQLHDSGAETIIVLSNFARTVQVAMAETSLKHVIVTNIGDMFPLPKAILTNFVVKYIKKKVPAWNIANAISYKKAIAEGKKKQFNKVDITGHDIAFLQYTGGTTGIAKGAILTHRNLVANIVQAEAWLKPIFEDGKEIAITALPLYHIFSLTANCLFLMKIGGLNVLLINARDTDQSIAEMNKFKFSVVTGVNTLFNAYLKHNKFNNLDFSGLKLTLGGGMAVQSAVAEKWQAVTGCVVLQAYGLTETSPCVSINPTKLKKYNGTVGLPVSSTDVCILDDAQNELPQGESGELAIKGPQVMRGYWQNPAETKKVFTEQGWLLTGDIASIDEQGFIHILERKKDMILVSGFNVYPNEIEDVLASMPGIREAAVVAEPDENAGEVPKAFIVRDRPDLKADEVIAFCRQKLTGYKIPKHVQFCDELPKTNVGKVLRRALRTDKSQSTS
jgi:long-chain acyl-CoA synthetase